MAAAQRALDVEHAYPGQCPLCGQHVTFSCANDEFRARLSCPSCFELYKGSLVRERALFHALNLHAIDLGALDVHEIAPAAFAGATAKVAKSVRSFVFSNFWPDRPLGDIVNGVHNENAERQSFADGAFDLVVSLDLMEHVNHPDRVCAEVHRTLRPGGHYVFTAPTYPHIMKSRRAALYTDSGVVHYEEPEYHGNPISDQGALVTWRYGYDFPELIRSWADFDVTVLRFDAPGLGLMGYFTETYVCAKPGVGA